MPTYEYRCPEGHEFEKFTQKISDAQGELPCPTCGKVAPRRMSAGGGLLFKGSGFYITDYGKDGKKDQRDAAAKAKDAPAKATVGAAASATAAPSSGAPAAPASSAPAPTSSTGPKPAAPSTPAPKSGPDK